MGRLLVSLSAPAMAGMAALAVYQITDTVFVGQGVGTPGLAAMTVCIPIQMFLLAFAQVVGIGASSIISRSLGSGHPERAERAVGTALVLAGLLGGGFSAAALLAEGPLIRAFGATPSVAPFCRDYLTILLVFGPLFSVGVSNHNLIRAEGNTRAAMLSVTIGAVINMALDPLFIFGFGMGMRGAALATAAGWLFSFGFTLRYFQSG
ncbi:polysaccharide biosynthesis C-terminal domain-containing protein, partial [Candidatus Fermentibacterales bacterium]|nr:polysaccharide biosynthesis C-terminal domain-containing protein [Candidatus Fermentibacterales bacterium]